ncbi:unnamed protein product [Prunus brigantina]
MFGKSRHGKWFPGTWESRGESESLLLTWVLFSLLMGKFGKMSQHSMHNFHDYFVPMNNL